MMVNDIFMNGDKSEQIFEFDPSAWRWLNLFLWLTAMKRLAAQKSIEAYLQLDGPGTRGRSNQPVGLHLASVGLGSKNFW